MKKEGGVLVHEMFFPCGPMDIGLTLTLYLFLTCTFVKKKDLHVTQRISGIRQLYTLEGTLPTCTYLPVPARRKR